MTPSPLPNKDQAWVEEAKVTTYLLKPDHPVGGPKARLFLGRGFTSAEWENMADALRHHAKHNSVTKAKVTRFATNYSLDCNLPTPDRSGPCIRTVWEVRSGDSRLRLDICQVLWLSGYMDRVGRGTQNIVAWCREAGLSDPQWEINAGVTLTLKYGAKTPAPRLNGRQRKLLADLEPQNS